MSVYFRILMPVWLTLQIVAPAAVRADKYIDFADNAIGACYKIKEEEARLQQHNTANGGDLKQQVNGELKQVGALVNKALDLLKNPPQSPAGQEKLRTDVGEYIGKANMQIRTVQRELGIRPGGALPDADCFKTRFQNCFDTPRGTPVPDSRIPQNNDNDFFQLRVEKCNDRLEMRRALLRDRLINCDACKGHPDVQRSHVEKFDRLISESASKCKNKPDDPEIFQ